jgi:hypothetical protein
MDGRKKKRQKTVTKGSLTARPGPPGTFSSTPAMLQAAAGIAAEKVVDLSEIVTHQYSLAEIEKAMLATERYYGLRAVINKF